MAKVKLEKDLYQRAAECARDMGYSSVDELVAHLVERAVHDREAALSAAEGEDMSAVEERLRGLGYIE